MMEKKILSGTNKALLIICGLIILIAVFLAGLFWGQQASKMVYQQGYNDAWQYARQLIEDSGFFPPEPDEVFNLSGEIVEINENKQMITLQAEPYSSNPLADTGSLMRTVKLDENTAIVKNTEKSIEQFNAEQTEYNALIAGLGPEDEIPDPPLNYETEVVDFGSLKTGLTVNISAQENIKDADEFIAERIEIYISAPVVEEEAPAEENEEEVGDVPLEEETAAEDAEAPVEESEPLDNGQTVPEE
jgi:hypothetical protein